MELESGWEEKLGDPQCRLHFVGVAGSGMSSLACYRAMEGGRVSGSDRFFDRGAARAMRCTLERAGVRVVPQDGSEIPRVDLVVASTAVEARIPDLAAARAAGLPILHRSRLLAHLAERGPSIAVAGTSGKSTVTAMIFEILRAQDRDPSLVTGGPLLSLVAENNPGNAWLGRGPLVFEADESDGSLVHYRPHLGIVLNLHKDHMEEARAREIFARFASGVRGPFLRAAEPALEGLGEHPLTFGFTAEAAFRGEHLETDGEGSRFVVRDIPVRLSRPGVHEAGNALAALAAAAALGLDLRAAAEALTHFGGVSRRFQVVGRARGVEVVDDFAHNPTKIQAALRAARERARRVHACFQPHGFAPTAFFRKELVEVFRETLRGEDTLTLTPIYYSGGTARRVIASEDVVEDLVRAGVNAAVAPRPAVPSVLAARAVSGDLILLMGARDPSLPELARGILAELQASDAGDVTLTNTSDTG